LDLSFHVNQRCGTQSGTAHFFPCMSASSIEAMSSALQSHG
jgi:hypothetical protein